jgi:hypothetical protein
MGGWIALAAVLILGARHGRYGKDGSVSAQYSFLVHVMAVMTKTAVYRRIHLPVFHF